MKKGIVIALLLLTLSGCTKKTTPNTSMAFEENIIKYDVSENQITLTYQINSIDKQIQKDGSYIISANGMHNTYDDIALPYVSYVLALPMNTNVDTITLEKTGDTKTMNDIDVSSRGMETTGQNTENFTNNLPCKSVVFVQSFQGVKVAYITLYPFIYDEDNNTLNWLEGGKVDISLKKEIWDLSHLENLDRVKNCIDNLEMIDEYKMHLGKDY